MKTHSNLALVICLLSVLNLTGQPPNVLDPFPGISSDGIIPDDLYKTSIEKYTDRWSEFQVENEKRRAKKNKEEFWQSQFQQIDRMVQSGRFVFGDPITNYYNAIADTLLQDFPELRKEIRIFTFKSPSVNAFCLADGVIGINVGLMAHVGSEAEIAFVIAHEISHYTEQHGFEQFKEIKSLDQSRTWRNSLHPIKKYDLIVSRGREQEFEADELGVELYLKSRYHPQAIDKALTTLFESFVPYGREEVGRDFLSTDEFTLPSIYFKEKLKPIGNQENYFDQTHNHPNIFKRRTALMTHIKATDSLGKSFFIQEKSKFFELREFARFEALREKLLYGRYGSALYDIYVLQKNYPNNTFLKFAKVKALYSLSNFKSVDEISEVVASTSLIEGPSLQVFYILKRLSKEQLVSIALHHTLKLQEEFPKAAMLEEFSSHLTRIMRVSCELEVEDFKAEEEDLKFDKLASDFPSERHFLRAQQNFHKNFYKSLLKKQHKNGWLKESFASHQAYMDSLDLDSRTSMDVKDDRKEEEEDLWDDDGIGIRVTKALLYINLAEEESKEIRKGNPEKWRMDETLDQEIYQLFVESGIETKLLSLKKLTKSDVKIYNSISSLEEWKNENQIFENNDLQSTFTSFTKDSELEGEYFIRINGWRIIYNIFIYQFELYKRGVYKPIYSRVAQVNNVSFRRKLQYEIEIDLNRINKIP